VSAHDAALARRAGAAWRRLRQAVRWRRAWLAWRFGSPGPIAGPAALADPYDVCVIGSGPAGATLALELAARRHRVLLVEAGPRRPWVARRTDARTGSRPTGYPIGESRCRGLGGTSNRWFGACPRLHPLDFEPNAYTPPGAAWPVRYADLAPYYERAERTLHVRTGTPSSPPAPPAGAGPDHGALAARLAAIGIGVDLPPLATGAGGVDRFRVTRDLLPQLTRAPGAAVVPNAEVLRLVTDGSGCVEAALVQDAARVIHPARAGIYVVAAGGLETPRLLLLSRDRTAPDGLGNASGLVGRFFMDHAKVAFRGVVRRGLPPGTGRSHQFYEQLKGDGLGSAILGFHATRGPDGALLEVSADVELVPSSANRVTLASGIGPGGAAGLAVHLALAEPDRRTLARVRDLIQRILHDLGAHAIVELPGAHGEVSWLFHHLGTCRMGGDPESAVVDADLRVHGTTNLYGLGSAVFVTAGAANPTLTIVALAHRLADHLHARLTTGAPPAAGQPGPG
jgi:choline dehydrogenase-like flavoprotein